MTQTRTIYCQKKAAAALEEEFGFAPARLNRIAVLEADDMCFCIHFRIGEHHYRCRRGKIERINGAP